LKEAGQCFGFELSEIGYLLHGTTIATNAVLQRKFPSGALVTTAGFEDVLEIVDYVLIMSVNPGFGGQQFIPYSLKKVRQLAAMRRERGLHFPIEIDGGVTLENVASVVHAGVEWIVAGSSVFHTVNPVASFEEMQQMARDASAVRV